MGHRLTRAVLLLALVTPVAALAQSEPNARGIDLVPFKFAPTWGSGLILDGAELPRKGSFALRAHLDFNGGILGLRLAGKELGYLVPFRATLNLMGSFQLHKHIELSADLPIFNVQATNFQLLRDQGFVTAADPSPVGIGDPRFIGRFRLLSQDFFIFGLAAIAEVRLPLGEGFAKAAGTETAFMGDRGLVFSPRLAIERSFGPVRIYGSGGWRLRTAPGQYLNLYVGQEFLLGAGAQLKLPEFAVFSNTRVMFEGNLSTPAEAPFNFAYSESLKTPFELMLGARTVVKDHFGLLLAVGTGIGARHGYGREIIRVTLGFAYEYEPEIDTDGDGIPDRLDKCPTDPEDFDGDQDEDGCPEPDLDSDGDGIPDKNDGCKDQPGPKDYDGCPDRDGDQIPDNVDKCPDEPGPAETEGCPVPKEEQVTLESDSIRIRGNILYETGKAIIQKQSYPLLDDVAKVLRDNPEVGPVLVEGHTDNVGSRPYNLDLSNRRAQSVADYLVGKGIKRERLRTAGYGFDRPMATNDTPLGRAKNRRTAFRLVSEDSDTPTPEGEKKDAPPPGAAPEPAPASPGPASPDAGSGAPSGGSAQAAPPATGTSESASTAPAAAPASATPAAGASDASAASAKKAKAKAKAKKKAAAGAPAGAAAAPASAPAPAPAPAEPAPAPAASTPPPAP